MPTDKDKDAPTTARIPKESAGLIVGPSDQDAAPEKDRFSRELVSTLEETERAFLALAEGEAQSWQVARELVQRFRPVPWFIWRISNFVLGTSGRSQPISEGLVFGLRRLLFATASDPVLGKGEKINSVRKALDILSPDVVAAVSVMHAICRKLASCDFERIWRPILDDALLRARIGVIVGSRDPSFGIGRVMLAGFAGRCGLAILIAHGEVEPARQALELLAQERPIKEVGMQIYGCDPLQVSAMTLSAAGCGRDAAFGAVAYTAKDPQKVVANQEQKLWLASFATIESIRTGRGLEIDPEYWKKFHVVVPDGIKAIQDEYKKIIRRGHGWGWMV